MKYMCCEAWYLTGSITVASVQDMQNIRPVCYSIAAALQKGAYMVNVAIFDRPLAWWCEVCVTHLR
jgi:hypothetical protein